MSVFAYFFSYKADFLLQVEHQVFNEGTAQSGYMLSFYVVLLGVVEQLFLNGVDALLTLQYLWERISGWFINTFSSSFTLISFTVSHSR